jgi:iron complex outermembrane receptor protein
MLHVISAKTIVRNALLGSAALAVLAAVPAFAQTMPEQTADPARVPSAVSDLEEAQEANPDEIVVVARRRAENILDVPISVSAFSEQQLINSGAYDLAGIQGAVPNLNIVQGRGSASSANITIRGIGQPDALQTFDPAVGVYVDGVYQSRIQGALFSMFDVQQVEVLRGPQGTLYGKNTIGGAINIISRKPGNDFVANASFAYGSYNQILANAYVAAPLIKDKLAVGIAGTYNKRDGIVTDPLTGEKYNNINNGTGRIIVRATPLDTLEVLFSADYTRQDSSLTLGQNTASICQLALGIPGLPQPPVNANCVPPRGFFGNRVIRPAAGPWKFQSSTDFRDGQGQEMTNWGMSGTVNAELSDALTLVSITAARNLTPEFYIDIDATTSQTGNVKVFIDQSQFSQELQLKLDTSRFNGVFGLYYLKENVGSDQVAYANDVFSIFNGFGGYIPVTFQRTVQDSQELNSYAAYGQLTWKATEAFSLTGGLRYTRETKQYFRTTTTTSSLPALNGTFTFPNSLVGNPLYTPGIDEQSWGAWTPMVTATLQVAPQQMIYFTASNGFKSGGFNGRANSVADLIQVIDGKPQLAVTFEPESAWNFEGGYKAAFADGKVTLAASAFYMDYTNFQARVGERDANGFGYLPVINAGAMQLYGFELESTIRLVPNLTLYGSLGYLNASYTEFDDTRANGCNPTGQQIVCTPAFAPPITARLAADYTIPLNNDAAINFGADGRFVDKQYLSVDNRNNLVEPGYTMLNAYIRYDAKHWYIMGQVRNATNAIYKTDAQEFSSVANIQTAYYGDPRTFLGTIGVRF